MTKKDLIHEIAAKSGMTLKDVDAVLDAANATILDAVKNGEKVPVLNLGSVEVETRKERSGFNPATQEKIVIPAKKVPKFKASVTLKEAAENSN